MAARLAGWLLFLALALAVLLPMGKSGQAQAAEPDAAIRQIRVVADYNYPPYIFHGHNGELVGVLVDQWRLWEKKTGIKVSLHALAWNQAQERMLRGEFDVIDTMFRTPARDKLYDFTPPDARIDVPVFARRGLTGLASLQDLRGMEVGVQEGDSVADILAAAGVTSLRHYPSYDELVQAASAGQVKVFVADGPPARFLLREHGLTASFPQAFIVNVGQFHRAVRKGDAALLKLVEQGFAKISQAEYEQIDKKWLGEPAAPRRD